MHNMISISCWWLIVVNKYKNIDLLETSIEGNLSLFIFISQIRQEAGGHTKEH